MRKGAFKAALKKEWKESVRRYRVGILVTAFLIVGIISPVGAKLMPKVFEMMASKSKVQGIELVFFREPGVEDALIQYHKNFGMLPILIAILGMGLVAEEKTRRTVEFVLTKPISRSSFLLSKFSCFSGIILSGIITGFATCLLYVYLLFAELPLKRLFFLNLFFFIYLIAFISIIIFFNVLLKNTATVAISGVGFYLLLIILGSFPEISKFTPQGLYNFGAKIIKGNLDSSWTIPLISSLLLSLLFLWISKIVFENQEI